MSKGPGEIQQWIMGELHSTDRAVSTAQLNQLLASERDGTPGRKRRPKDRARSLRNSLTRALRTLERAGEIKRDTLGNWTPTRPNPARVKIESERVATAYHEAGHAVIGRARRLPIALATINPRGRKAGYVTGITDRAEPIGEVWRWDAEAEKIHRTKHAAHLDAYGNAVPPREPPTVERCEAEILMCIAGPLADALHTHGDASRWREEASSSDMANARLWRERLGEKAREWPDYERETAKLVRKFWSMIEAVAKALLKRDFVSGYDIDTICTRVARGDVRRQHLK